MAYGVWRRTIGDGVLHEDLGHSLLSRPSWSGYNRRSLVETMMYCIKRLGEQVISRTFERQVNELHIRTAIVNRFIELGCPLTVAVILPLQWLREV